MDPASRFGTTDEDRQGARQLVDDTYYRFLLMRREIESLGGKVSPTFVAQKTGIPATTIQGWLKGAVPQPRKEKPPASRKRKPK